MNPPTALFDYLAIAFGLLYSVAALRVLGGLPAALVRERRSWLHLGLTFETLGLITISFWTFWSLREVHWTFRGFVLALLVPGFLYYLAAVLVPENPENVRSWREHYFDAHQRWYGGLALWAVGAAASATVNLGMGWLHPARAIHVVAIAIGLVGALSSNRKVHAFLVILLAVLWFAGALNPRIDSAGWLAKP